MTDSAIFSKRSSTSDAAARIVVGPSEGWGRDSVGRRLRRNASAFVNMVDAWPEDVYREKVVAGRLLGRPVVYVVDPECVRALLVDDADRLVRDDAMSRALDPLLGAGLLTSDGAAWRAQRRTAAPAFRPDRVRSSVPAMAASAQALCEVWSAPGVGGVFDVQNAMMRASLDIIVSTMVSGDDGFGSKAFGAALHRYLGLSNWKIAYGVLGAPAWFPHPGFLACARAARDLRRMAARVIERRRSHGHPGDDLLGAVLSATDPETGSPLDDGQLIDNLLTFVVAGHETTALAMSWVLRLVAEHPAVERRLLEEMAAALRPGEDGFSVDALPYARQVVSEAMRLYPPAALLVRRASEEVRIGDVRVPPGGSIHIPVFALHRHSRIWDDAEAFDPDRFAPDRQRSRHRFAFLPFGAGPRVCIAGGMAVTECLVLLATLLPRFRFEAAGLVRPRARLRVTLRPVGGMPLRVTRRDGA